MNLHTGPSAPKPDMAGHPLGNEIELSPRNLIAPTELVSIVRRIGLSLRSFAYLMVMNLLSVGFEIMAIGMLLPVLELMRAGGESAIGKLQGAHWDVMQGLSAATGIPITMALLLVVSFGFVLLRQLFRYYATRYKHTLERSMANQLRQQVFSRYLVADTAIQDRAQVGSLVPFIQVELRRALDVLMASTNSITLIFQIVSYFVALSLLSPVMSLICAGVMLVTALLVQRPMAQIKGRGAKITKLNREIVSFMVERLRHARLIRLSHTEKAETKAFHDLSVGLSQESLQQQMVGVRMQLLLEPVVILAAFLTFMVGGHVLGMSFERLGFFAIVLIRLVPTLRNMLTQYSHIVGQLPSLEALDRYIRQIRDARESKGGSRQFARLDHGIRYEHVSYSYASSDAPALVDVTFFIPAHRMTALVGPSGSGKSTTIDLLPRLRIPSSGDILLDGVSITEFSAASLRGGIAFVPQQPQIFNITAAEHIRYGKEDATDEDVREAARLAGALNFIERLPQGFNTLLGDGGKLLSGGQRQRLDIARALVRRAPILVLDEPTSALDAEAEAAFRDALRSLRIGTNLTIIVIAHRLSTIADADTILLFENGRLTASGTHEQLMALGNWYAEAYKLQRSERVLNSALN